MQNTNQLNGQGTVDTAERNDEAMRETPAFRPNVDIVAVGDEILIYADLPGALPEGIEVQFDRGVLEISARVAPRNAERTTLREEYAVGDFRRSFRLSEEFDGSQTTAEYRDGVLCLRVPKAAQARATKVQVRANNG